MQRKHHTSHFRFNKQTSNFSTNLRDRRGQRSDSSDIRRASSSLHTAGLRTELDSDRCQETHTSPHSYTAFYTQLQTEGGIYSILSKLMDLHTYNSTKHHTVTSAQQKSVSRAVEESCVQIFVSSPTCVAGSAYPSIWTAADSRSHTAAPIPASLWTDRYGNKDKLSTYDPYTALTSRHNNPKECTCK